MKKFILPALLASLVGLTFVTAQAQASWLSNTLRHTRIEIYPSYAAPAYVPQVYAPQVVAPSYYSQPVYSPPIYVQPIEVQPIYAPPAYLPPVRYDPAPGYYLTPRYYSRYENHHREYEHRHHR